MVRQPDPAWQHCTSINGKSSRVRCNFCGHTMWGGITRFKEHLANKKGDVIACPSCPPELTTQMANLLMHQTLNKDDKQRGKRKSIEKMMKRQVDKEKQDKACLEQAIQESIQTYEKEKQQAELDNNVYEIALRESLNYYETEKRMRHGGCSGADNAGPSHVNDDDFNDLEAELRMISDYDSDLGF